MVLMTIDHADAPLNQTHYWVNSAHFQGFGVAAEPLSFATRLLTHLCAPTFLFLAGVSVVLSAESAKRRGMTDTQIDKHLGLRGLLLIALDPLVMTFAFGVWWAFSPSRVLVLQVLYAIGVALALSPALRRLPNWALLVGAAGLVSLTEFTLPSQIMQVDFTVSPPLWPPCPATSGPACSSPAGGTSTSPAGSGSWSCTRRCPGSPR